MSRTFKDKPFRTRKKTTFPFGYTTRWNDCTVHGKLCSNARDFYKKQVLRRRAFLHHLVDED